MDKSLEISQDEDIVCKATFGDSLASPSSQSKINSGSDFYESIFKMDDVTFEEHLKTVTERKRKWENSGPPSRKKRSLPKVDSTIFPSYKEKPHFIPTEVQLSLFKASVIGRNEAEMFLKKSGIKKLTSVFSSSKLHDRDKRAKQVRSSSVPKKLTTLFCEIDSPNISPNTKNTIGYSFNLNEIENCSPNVNKLLQEDSPRTNVNVELLQTPKMNNSHKLKNVAPLSGIRKLADSPLTSLPSTPVSSSSNNKRSPQIDDILSTQPVSEIVLNGVVAFVDVRSDSENQSKGVKDVLTSLGAKVENYFTKKVSVVVFKDGLMSTYKRAQLWNVPMVSILWIEACKEELEIVPMELHPPLGLEKYESALTLGFVSKKKTRKKLGEENKNSTHQVRNKKEELDEPKPSASTNNKQTEPPKTPSHQDGFIKALLTVAGDELKDFLNRPFTQPIDEDSHMDLPLSVRLLHKHVFERGAITTQKESLGSLEENIKKLSDKGRIKLKKLVFPSCNEEECDAENMKERDNFTYEKNTFKRPESKKLIVSAQLAKDPFENHRKSAPAALFTARIRRSAPAKIGARKKTVKQKLDIENGNIVKYFIRPADIEGNINNINFDSSQKITNRENKTNKETKVNKENNTNILPLDVGSPKDKIILNINRPTHSKCLTQSQSENVLKNLTNTSIRRKRKLLPLGSNIYLTEPVCISCEPSPVICPYTESPEKKKKTQNLATQGSSKLFIKPAVPKQKLMNITSSISESETSSTNRRGSSILFVETKEKKTDLQRLAPSIVCTSIHRKDIDLILGMINQLGTFSLEQTVSERTTHVVTCATRRTVNLLKGIAHGSWIVKDEWVYKSFEAGKWLNEEPFELVEFSPAVKQSRIERLAFGPEFCLELFQHVGFIYVCKGTSPPTADLVELLRLCGGKLVTNPRIANIIVGSRTKQSGINGIHVMEKWVLDSISRNTQLSPQLYRYTDCEP